MSGFAQARYRNPLNNINRLADTIGNYVKQRREAEANNQVKKLYNSTRGEIDNLVNGGSYKAPNDGMFEDVVGGLPNEQPQAQQPNIQLNGLMQKIPNDQLIEKPRFDVVSGLEGEQIPGRPDIPIENINEDIVLGDAKFVKTNEGMSARDRNKNIDTIRSNYSDKLGMIDNLPDKAFAKYSGMLDGLNARYNIDPEGLRESISGGKDYGEKYRIYQDKLMQAYKDGADPDQIKMMERFAPLEEKATKDKWEVTKETKLGKWLSNTTTGEEKFVRNGESNSRGSGGKNRSFEVPTNNSGKKIVTMDNGGNIIKEETISDSDLTKNQNYKNLQTGKATMRSLDNPTQEIDNPNAVAKFFGSTPDTTNYVSGYNNGEGLTNEELKKEREGTKKLMVLDIEGTIDDYDITDAGKQIKNAIVAGASLKQTEKILRNNGYKDDRLKVLLEYYKALK